MKIYDHLKILYLSMRKEKDHNREIYRDRDYKWVLGYKIAEEINMIEEQIYTRNLIADTIFLFGIEVEIDEKNPDTIKLYEDITNKIGAKVRYKKPEVIEYKGCRNCKFSPGPLQMCDWMKQQKTLYLKCPRWEPKEEQEGRTAEE